MADEGCKKKAVSWYINNPADSPNGGGAEIEHRKKNGKRILKTKSLDPKIETKMTINSAQTKSAVDYADSMIYEYVPLRKGNSGPVKPVELLPAPEFRVHAPHNMNTNTRLLDAVANGHSQETKRLLYTGANPNATCRLNHVSACHIAAMTDSDSLAYLIEAGAETLRADKLGRTPLHLAAWFGNTKQIAMLLNIPEELQNKFNQGISPEMEKEVKQFFSVPHCMINLATNIGTLKTLPEHWTDSMAHNCRAIKEKLPLFKPGWTALHSASARAHVDCVQLLLAAGGDPKARDLIGRTPLDTVGVAYYSGHWIDVHNFSQTISILLNGDVKFSTHDCPRKENTPLHTAVLLESLEAIVELLNGGASPLKLDENGLTPMHICVERRLKEHLQFLANYLYEDQDPYLAPIDVKDDMGQTVLYAAIKANWMDGVCIALGAGASIFMKANDGNSSMHCAATATDIRIPLHILSVANFAIDYRNQKGQTALFIAIMQNNLTVVKLLLEHGASLNNVLPDHQTVLHVAAHYGFNEILDYLLNYDNRIVSSLLRANSHTPIMAAVINNHPECVKLLLKKGAELHDKVEFKDGNEVILTTLLHIAAANNFFQIARMIVEFDGLTIHNPNGNGLLPLHEACIQGNREIILLLIHKGADFSRRPLLSKKRQTPIEMIMNNLSKPVAYMEEVLDSYIYSEGKNLLDKECKVTVNYAILMPNSIDGKQMKVLKALIDSGNRYNQRKLLHHPLVESFLYLKWNALVPYFYAITMLFGLFVLALNVYIVSAFYYQDKNKQYLNDTKQNISDLPHLSMRLMPEYLHPKVWVYMLYLTVSLVTLQEIIFIKITNKRYFLLLETWVKFVAIGLSIFLPFVLSWERTNEVPDFETSPEWVRLIATIALLLSWLEFMFLLSRYPSWGFYVLMFGKVATKVFKILLTFMFLIIGFSLCFMIQFRAKTPFEGPWAAITKTLVMMTTEYDYMGMINIDTAEEIAASISILRALFITFLILASIVLMNLMVGVAVNDVNSLADIGNQKRLEKQVDFLTSLEDIVCHKLFRNLLSRFNSTLSIRKKVLNKIILIPREATCSYSKILPKSLREAIFEKAQLQKKQIDDEIGSMAYHLKLDEIHEAVVRKEGEIDNSYQYWPLRPFNLNETVRKMNKDIEELRDEIKVIKDLLLRRNSIH